MSLNQGADKDEMWYIYKKFRHNHTDTQEKKTKKQQAGFFLVLLGPCSFSDIWLLLSNQETVLIDCMGSNQKILNESKF